MKAGDAVGFESHGVFATLIRLKQRMLAAGGTRAYLRYLLLVPFRGKREWPWWVRVTHLALVTEVVHDNDGLDAWIVQAVRHVNEVSLRYDYAGVTKHLIPLPAAAKNRASLATRWASKRIGVEYGIVTILSLALNTFTPAQLRLDFTKAGSLICSGLVAQAWEQAGIDWGVDSDPNQIIPGQVASLYGEEKELVL